VLRRKHLLNKDAVIVLLSEGIGKVAVIAKGVRSITSRRLSSLMTGNLIQIVISQSRETFYLQQVKTISLFSQIKKSPAALRQAYFFLYLADNLLPEHQREDAAYLKIKRIMIALSKANYTPAEELTTCKDFLLVLGYHLKADSLPQARGEIEEITGKKIPAILYN
jgi:DNA repair protein RecO